MIFKCFVCMKEFEEFDYEILVNSGFMKKEFLFKKCEFDKLYKLFGGICNFMKMLFVFWVVDVKCEYFVIDEVKKFGILVIGIFDMNVDLDDF